MAFENLGKMISRPAGGNLSALQYHFAKLSAGAAVVAGDGEDAIGVLQDNTAVTGQAAGIMVGAGITKVVAGGTVTADGLVAVNASGRAVDAVSGDNIMGRALEGTTVNGEVITILFQKGGIL